MRATVPRRPAAREAREAREARTEERKEGRVELRTTREEKRLLVAAAAHEHLDVTAFVLRSAIPAARQVVDESGRLRLSSRDTERVLELLEHPPALSDHLVRAAAALRVNEAAARQSAAVRSAPARPSPRSRSETPGKEGATSRKGRKAARSTTRRRSA